jgi:hypothetical protein
MRKITKVGMASVLTVALAGGATAAFANADHQPQKKADVTRDFTREHSGTERLHDTAKDRSTDRNGKDTYKETWDRSNKDGSTDGSKDTPSPDAMKG